MDAYEASRAWVTRSGRHKGCARRKTLRTVTGMAPENGLVDTGPTTVERSDLKFCPQDLQTGPIRNTLTRETTSGRTAG